ncbi:hypothetical protein EDB81DRAFT_10097 [Dactylonectria macrodidyma]|uniref:Uncharacterized protein n=1 Tax=Dactylonectria macrodidyma TaxID=307937 RepID=A0A9P9JIG7_9HYPO|nr:hypothetical protein EDB81DRAFT_10097 [Dactylonectria macrodidyma]
MSPASGSFPTTPKHAVVNGLWSDRIPHLELLVGFRIPRVPQAHRPPEAPLPQMSNHLPAQTPSSIIRPLSPEDGDGSMSIGMGEPTLKSDHGPSGAGKSTNRRRGRYVVIQKCGGDKLGLGSWESKETSKSTDLRIPLCPSIITGASTRVATEVRSITLIMFLNPTDGKSPKGNYVQLHTQQKGTQRCTVLDSQNTVFD